MQPKRRFLRRVCLAGALTFSILAPTSSSKATTHIIQFVSFSYNPNTLTVAVGDTIEWQGDFLFHPLGSISVPPGADPFSNSSGTTFTYVIAVPGTYTYQCMVHGPFFGMTGSIAANPTGVGDQQGAATPGAFQLHQNFPNPFNPTTAIRFSVPNSSVVTLKVFDILGNMVTTLVNEKKSPGSYVAEFDGSHLASGIYLYRLQAGNFSDTKKLLLIK